VGGEGRRLTELESRRSSSLTTEVDTPSLERRLPVHLRDHQLHQGVEGRERKEEGREETTSCCEQCVDELKGSLSEVAVEVCQNSQEWTEQCQ
jgi:hypothetical protein